MGTFGVAAHTILEVCCAYGPTRLRSIAGRFLSPVFPGETIRTEIWVGDDVMRVCSVMFRAHVVERDVVVLDHGHAEIAA